MAVGTVFKALRWKCDGSIPETVSRGPCGISTLNKKENNGRRDHGYTRGHIVPTLVGHCKDFGF